MSWTYSEDYYKRYTYETWNECAKTYQEFMRLLEPYGEDLLRALAARPGERVLDLATGPGEPALTIARQVAPEGRVTGVDLSDEMIALARETAKRLELSNVEFEVMDAENLSFEDATFDAVVSRFGFQIFTDPERVGKEALRVLKPGGRLALSVWSTGDKVPSIDAIIAPMLEHAEPDETGYIPTPYEMGGPNELTKILEGLGFRDARETRVTHDFVFRDEDHYLHVVLEGSPIGHSLSEEDEHVQKDVLAKTRENLQRWKGPDGIRMPAEAVIVTARK